MAYSGKYTVKNPKKYQGDHTKVVYRSMWEKWCFKWCDENSDVKIWSSEEVVVPYFYEVDKKYHRYFVDLKGHLQLRQDRTHRGQARQRNQAPSKSSGKKTKRYINEGLTYVKNINKWKAAKRYAKDRNWEFVIWTENTLESMGIKPKSTKPLKPFKRKKVKK